MSLYSLAKCGLYAPTCKSDYVQCSHIAAYSLADWLMAWLKKFLMHHVPYGVLLCVLLDTQNNLLDNQ